MPSPSEQSRGRRSLAVSWVGNGAGRAGTEWSLGGPRPAAPVLRTTAAGFPEPSMNDIVARPNSDQTLAVAPGHAGKGCLLSRNSSSSCSTTTSDGDQSTWIEAIDISRSGIYRSRLAIGISIGSSLSRSSPASTAARRVRLPSRWRRGDDAKNETTPPARSPGDVVSSGAGRLQVQPAKKPPEACRSWWVRLRGRTVRLGSGFARTFRARVELAGADSQVVSGRVRRESRRGGWLTRSICRASCGSSRLAWRFSR